MDTKTGKMDMVEAEVGVVMEAGCEGVQVVQACVSQGRGSDGVPYCDEFSREVTIIKTDGAKVNHKMTEARGRVRSAKAVCEDNDLVQVVLVMEDSALVSLPPTASVMFVREEGLASLQLGQMGGMDVDTGNSDLFDIHRIAHPGNFLDPQVLVNNFLSRIKRHVSQLQSLLLSITDFRLTGEKKSQSGKIMSFKHSQFFAFVTIHVTI